MAEQTIRFCPKILEIRLIYKKWWWYLYPKRRKWLKEVNAIMNSPKVQSEIGQKLEKLVSNGFMYGTGISHIQK